MLCRVYYNLHKKCYSVQTKNPGRGWRLAFHADDLVLKDVVFKVYEKGRRRVLKTGHKNVHCFILGELCNTENFFDTPIRIRYNPYTHGYFVTEEGEAIHSAKHVQFTKQGVWASVKPTLSGES